MEKTDFLLISVKLENSKYLELRNCPVFKCSRIAFSKLKRYVALYCPRQKKLNLLYSFMLKMLIICFSTYFDAEAMLN